MAFIDEINKIDPNAVPFEKKASNEAQNVIQEIIDIAKFQISKANYASHATFKEWKYTRNLVIYHFHTVGNRDIRDIPAYKNKCNLYKVEYDRSCNYGVDYEYGTYYLEEAEYFTDLVVRKLEQEGFQCQVEKLHTEHSKGLFQKSKWGTIGFIINISLRWN